MEEGRVEGKHEANTETAQRLLAMGLSTEQVAKATQLPLEIIKNLSNSKNSSFACKLHTLQVSEEHHVPTRPERSFWTFSPYLNHMRKFRTLIIHSEVPERDDDSMPRLSYLALLDEYRLKLQQKYK